MIKAEFKKCKNTLCGVTVSGHAEYAGYGEDIVCAAVSSALEMCANAITHLLNIPALVEVGENKVDLMLPEESPESGENFLKALKLHLENLQQDYPKNIKIFTSEVERC